MGGWGRWRSEGHKQQHAFAACAFALLVLVYLWQVLVGGRILSPFTDLYGFPPWRRLVPGDARDYFNPVLFDIQAVTYPWRSLVRSLLHDGTFPAWNPSAFTGVPLFANPQTGLFSLFNVPLWVLSLNHGLGVSAALKLWAGAFGTYMLVRELRLGFWPGILAGTCFSFSALNVVWLTHETLPAVAVMLPWMVWFIERLVRGGRLGSLLGLAAVTAVALGGGHPGMQVHVLVATGMYAVLRATFDDGASWQVRVRGAGLALAGLALGMLLMAFMLLPEALSTRDTIGLSARRNGGELPGSAMPLTTLRTVVFPDWWGRPSGFEVPNISALLPNYNERTFYAGSVGLLFAAMALVSGGAWRRKAPFVVLGVVGLAVPLHAPGLYWLVTHAPVLKVVQSQRLHFLYAFAVAVLAAFGMQGMIERPRGARLRPLVIAAGLALSGVAFAHAGAQPGDLGRVLKHFVTGVEIASPSIAALTSVAWFLLFVLVVGVGLAVAWRWPDLRRPVAGALVLIACVDAYHFAHGYQPMTPVRAVPPVTPAIAYLRHHARGSRLVGVGDVFIGESATTYGLRDVRGYGPPQPSERFYRFWRLLQPDQQVWLPFEFGTVDARALRLLSTLGAGWIVAAPDTVPPGRGLHLGGRELRPLPVAYRGPDAVVLRNPNVAPRAMVPSSVVLTDSEQEVLDELAIRPFVPRRTAVVERDQPGAERLRARPARGRVAIVEDDNARVKLQATLQRPGLVVLNDGWAEGWTVRVDGRQAPMLHVNEVMRGVVVGAGRHEVVWSYSVPGLRLGAVLSAFALLVCAACAAARTLRVRRGRIRRERV
jgi:hypothetical protein